MKVKRNFLKLNNNDGFTLVEIIIVVVILSLMALFIAPRLATYLGSRRTNFLNLTSMITKTFDASYLKGKIYFLVIHLYEAPEFDSELDDFGSRRNGISVSALSENGTFVDVEDKQLKYKEFPDNFILQEVLLPSKITVKEGNVFIPFYPNASSDDAILHIRVDEEDWSVRFYKFKKEADIFPGFITFEE